MTDGSQYDADYFMHGRATGKSLYEDYRWLSNLTIPMVQAIVSHCGITRGDRILDFGCARGYVVKAFRRLGYEASGIDISEWAIENADEEARPFLSLVREPVMLRREFDWVIAKDVLEHVPYVSYAVTELMGVASVGVFAVVPLSRHDCGRYVVEDYERDVTHIQRYRLPTWVDMFLRPGWSVEASFRVPGVKDNYAQHDRGNGFVTARRIK